MYAIHTKNGYQGVSRDIEIYMKVGWIGMLYLERWYPGYIRFIPRIDTRGLVGTSGSIQR